MDKDSMNIHHVGIILPYQDSQWWGIMNDHVKLFESLYSREDLIFKNMKDFQCLCYLYGYVEFIIPYGGKLLTWLEENKSGLHHVAFEVADIKQASRELKEKGYTLICDEPLEGVDNMRVNFVHPKDTTYGLYEIVEVKQ